MPIEITLTLSEPKSVDYVYIDANNQVHVLLPLVTGETIGLDNTCKTQLELQRFFGLRTDTYRQGEPNSAKEILVKYKKALEHDIAVLNPIDPQGSLITIKRARLTQITSYITLLQAIERKWQEDLAGATPKLPEPMLRLLNAKTNCLSIQLSPKIEDPLIRTQNPVFSVARKPRDRHGAIEYPQEVLNRMNGGDFTEWDHPGLGKALRAGLQTAVNQGIPSIKEGLISTIINSNTFNHVTEWRDDEIAKLQTTLNHAIKKKLNCDVDCSKSSYSENINVDYITNILLLDPNNLSLNEMIEILFNASLSDNFWNNHHSIFMPTGNRADRDWLEQQVDKLSIKVQFFLAQVNIYCREHQLLSSPDTNLGQLFDRQWIADDIVDAIKEAFNTGSLVEANLFNLINNLVNLINNLGTGGTTNRLLSRRLNSTDQDKIMSNFISQYNTIADSPHFDEFIIFLNEKTTGDFFNHNNRISVHVWDVLTPEQKNRYPLLNRHATLLKNTPKRCLPHINPVDNSVRVEDINPANGNTPLHLFAELGDEEKVSEVLNYFFTTHQNLYDQTNNQGCTALHLACIHGNNNIVRALINTNQINLFARNRDGDNIIDLAIKHNKKDLLLLLLVTIKNKLHQNAQSECLSHIDNGQYQNIDSYLAINYPDWFKKEVPYTEIINNAPLFDALLKMERYELFFELLMKLRPRTNHTMVELLPEEIKESLNTMLMSITNAKKMPLRHAVACNRTDMIDTLLLLNPNLINQKDKTGSTVLHQAMLRGNRINEKTIKHLLQKNPDILLIRNRANRNAFDLAAEQNNTNIMLLLLNQAKRLQPEEQKEFLARVSPDNPYDTIYLYAALEKEDLFFNLLLNGATRTETARVERVRNNMQTIEFDLHVTKIKEHCALMRQEAAHNPNYHSAVSTADTLIRELTQAKITFLENGDTVTFKDACQAAIHKAKPVLSTHRKWENLLAGLLLALVTLPISLPLYMFGVFSVKTKSEQLINGLETQINTLTNNHP
jgi:ankyrin repeat protein